MSKSRKGLPARSYYKPMLGVKTPVNCQPAALVSPCWVSKPLRAARPQLLSLRVGCRRSCGLPARSSRKPVLGVYQNPCRLPARSFCKPVLGIKISAGCQPAALVFCKPVLGVKTPAGCPPNALASPCWVSNSLRVASPQLLQTRVGCQNPCGLPARSSCKVVLGVKTAAGCQPAALASPC